MWSALLREDPRSPTLTSIDGRGSWLVGHIETPIGPPFPCLLGLGACFNFRVLLGELFGEWVLCKESGDFWMEKKGVYQVVVAKGHQNLAMVVDRGRGLSTAYRSYFHRHSL